MTLDEAEERALSRIERQRELADALLEDAQDSKNPEAIRAMEARLVVLTQDAERVELAAAMWRSGQVLPSVANWTKGAKR